MAETPQPVLMLLALHVDSMLPMPYLFWRVRRLAQTMQRQPGILKIHRWLSRRSLLIISWWQDGAAAEAWLNHPEQRRMLQWTGARPKLGLWIELYEPMAESIHLRARGMPQVAAEERESSSEH